MDWIGPFLLALLNLCDSGKHLEGNALREAPKKELRVNFKGLGSSRCLEVLNGATTVPAEIVIGDCLTNTNKQLWIFRAASYQFREWTSFVNGASLKCMGTLNRAVDNLSPVGQVACDLGNTDPQSGAHWRLVKNVDPEFSNDAYRIVHMKSSRCLTVANGNTGNGAKLVIANCGSDAQNQLWDMTHAKFTPGG